jgi:PAS domain S-box-containing protein
VAARRQLQQFFASRAFGLAAALIAIGIVLVTALLTLRSAQNLATGRTWVDHTHTVIEAINGVVGPVERAETSHRGFVITGQEDFLTPLRAFDKEAREKFGYLQTLVTDNPQQRDAAVTLGRMVDEKLAYMRNSVAIRQERGFEAAAASIKAGRGHALMDTLHRTAAEMEARERALLAMRSARDANNLRRAERLGAAAILIALAFSLLAVFLLRRSIVILEAGRRRAEYLWTLVNATSDGIYGIDEDGNFTFVNNAMAAALGYTAEELIGRPSHATIHHTRADGSPFPESECPLYRVLQGGTPAELDNDIIWRRDGTSLPVEYSISPVVDNRGRAGAVVSFRDITARQEAERALRQGKLAAETASAQKSDFLARMSHELRTPLNSVIGFANVLRRNRRGALEASDLDYIERIRKNGVHLLELINDILDVSKIESGKMEIDVEPVALAALIGDVITQFDAQVAARSLSLRSSVPANMQPLETDRVRLQQVLMNVIGNAVKFTEHGEVTVTVVADQENRPRCIEIADTGIGIPADRLTAIFEPFEQAERTTTRRFGGTGLGLAISRTLCEMMGYTLSVESVEGAGSTFTINLQPGA